MDDHFIQPEDLAQLSSEYECRLHVQAELEEMSAEELLNQYLISSRKFYENEHSSNFRQLPRIPEFPSTAVKYHGKSKFNDPEPLDEDDGIAQAYIDEHVVS